MSDYITDRTIQFLPQNEWIPQFNHSKSTHKQTHTHTHTQIWGGGVMCKEFMFLLRVMVTEFYYHQVGYIQCTLEALPKPIGLNLAYECVSCLCVCVFVCVCVCVRAFVCHCVCVCVCVFSHLFISLVKAYMKVFTILLLCFLWVFAYHQPLSDLGHPSITPITRWKWDF